MNKDTETIDEIKIILAKLISAKSESPIDAGLIDYIGGILSEAGFKTYIKTFGEGPLATKNLYAEYGENGKNLCFAGHVDVVPAGDDSKWLYPPYEMTEDNNLIYGRGAVDMKGAIASMLYAGIKWARAGRKEKISFLITADEEASGEFGTKEMLKWLRTQNIKIDFAIIGEPTCNEKIGDTIKIGRRGSINFELEVFGKQGHVAYPELADNPIDRAIKASQALLHHQIDEGSDLFSPSNLEITSIDTFNNVRNVIPGSTKIKFNIRSGNAKSPEDIINEIDSIIAINANEYKLSYTISGRSFASQATEFTYNFKDLVEKICHTKASFSTSGGTSDARFIIEYCPLLEFGLLNKTAHMINENTEISHLQKLTSVYTQAIGLFHSY
ncbi:MAG: succinyl-diaminopimelate desuccinylase [Rickettsiaceae bacterium]|nr:succinyl-diaminopimelate desuccinylase [Rickettsiaceae bacterium]